MKATRIKIKLTFFFIAVYLYKKRKALINRLVNLKSDFKDFENGTNSDIKNLVENYYKVKTELALERFKKKRRILRRNRLRRKKMHTSKRTNVKQ